MNDTRTNYESSSDIDCITNDANDTLLYVVSKQSGGWTIYSSDTRVPAIVAQSDEGSYAELMQNEHAAIWIQSMAEDIGLIKTLDDDALNFTKEEIESNKAFWKSITSPDKFVKDLTGQKDTRAGKHPPIPVGHYELVYSETYGEVYDSISRLTQTRWHQGSPYNNFCPYRSDTVNVHAPAGCVAIAAAQMLYFLNDSLGVPTTAPSQAYCYSTVNDYPNYNWDQTTYTTTVWDDMHLFSFAAAPLIANVGRRLNTRYENYSTTQHIDDLEYNVFAPYGISCINYEYNTTQMKTSLLNRRPVLLGAHYNSNESGHAFIADRYRRSRTVTVNYYSWVWDYIPPLTPVPDVEEKIEYTYSAPTITMIGMNWGWFIPFYATYNPNNEWFSLTGDWIIHGDSTDYNYNITRKMIYNFHPVNN